MIHIPEEVIGEHMKQYCREQGFKFRKGRLLVEGIKAKKIMLSAQILLWYLEHRLEFMDLHKVVKFSLIRCFSNFVRKCISAHCEANHDPELALQGDTYKTLINLWIDFFNKEKFCNTSYLKGHSSIKLAMNNPNFRKAIHLTEELYEVESAKNLITRDIPIQIGFCILNYGKL